MGRRDLRNCADHNKKLYLILHCFDCICGSRAMKGRTFVRVIFHVFVVCCFLLLFLFKSTFSKISLRIPSECQTVWVQIRPDETVTLCPF